MSLKYHTRTALWKFFACLNDNTKPRKPFNQSHARFGDVTAHWEVKRAHQIIGRADADFLNYYLSMLLITNFWGFQHFDSVLVCLLQCFSWQLKLPDGSSWATSIVRRPLSIVHSPQSTVQESNSPAVQLLVHALFLFFFFFFVEKER